jgi:hypothetical protein
MKERRHCFLLLLFLMLVTICQPAAPARDFVLNQLATTCSDPGDVASAKFVTLPTHRLVLQLLGTGMSVAGGTANFKDTKFQNVSVHFAGDCVEDLIPASLIVRIRFIKPGTTAILDHGYDCARNIARVDRDGHIHVLITTQSLCDCDDMIPPGSTLLSVSLNLTCADTNSTFTHREQIYRLEVNDQPIPFDCRARGAFCSFD